MGISNEDLEKAMPTSAEERYLLRAAASDCLDAKKVNPPYDELIESILDITDHPLTDKQTRVLLRTVFFARMRDLSNIYPNRPIQTSKKASNKTKKSKQSTISPWEALGVSPNDNRETCRKAYITKIQQYHPDKVASLAPEFQILATKLSAEINAAWAMLEKMMNYEPH